MGFTTEGVDVFFYNKGMQERKAIDKLENTSFSVLLIDVHMPVMDGVVATRWIRKRGVQMPIVAVTGSSDSELRRRCVEVGMNDLLVKPVKRADIQRVLERQMPKVKV